MTAQLPEKFLFLFCTFCLNFSEVLQMERDSCITSKMTVLLFFPLNKCYFFQIFQKQPNWKLPALKKILPCSKSHSVRNKQQFPSSDPGLQCWNCLKIMTKAGLWLVWAAAAGDGFSFSPLPPLCTSSAATTQDGKKRGGRTSQEQAHFLPELAELFWRALINRFNGCLTPHF